MKSSEGIQAAVYTRWHQLSVPLAFVLAAGSFMLVVLNRGPIGLGAALAVLGLLVPPLVVLLLRRRPSRRPTRARVVCRPR